MADYKQKEDSNQAKNPRNESNDLVKINNPFLTSKNQGTNPFFSPSQLKENPFLTPNNPNINPFLDSSSNKISNHIGLKPETNQPIQRKIESNKLNIVGEHHTESNERGRENEKEFIREKYSLEKYWEEPEFAVDLDENGKETFGDDPLLGLAQDADTLSFYLDIMKENLRSDNNEINYKNVVKYIQQSSLSITHYINSTDNQEEINCYKGLKDEFDSVTDDFKTIFEPIFIDSDVKDENRDRAFELMHENVDLIKNVAEIIIKKITPDIFIQGGDRMMKISDKRSDHMLNVARKANLNGNNNGVWKVGDLHIDDMNHYEDYFGIEKLTITKESEFTGEFNDWKEEKNRAKEQPSHNSNN